MHSRLKMYYDKELTALKRANRYRTRKQFDAKLIDLASNDYLGLSANQKLAQRAFKHLDSYDEHAPKASMLVNGYHPLHQKFEDALCELNGFEAGVILGSGFSANIAMIESLVRKGDTLFMDELYHASGQLASKLVDGKVITFKHNDANDLEKKLQEHKGFRNIIAVEGIYSMDGDLLNREIIDIADEADAILIVDEAHSSGVVGPNLLGVFDHYDLPIKENYIKMGTLGKAYGSFGAYILASTHIVDFLINRAKPIIYATAPSLFDTALGLEALHYIQKEKKSLIFKRDKIQKMIFDTLGFAVPALIVPIVIDDNKKVLLIQEQLLKEGYIVGAIRQPTVEHAIIRIIARLNIDPKALKKALDIVLSYKKQ